MSIQKCCNITRLNLLAKSKDIPYLEYVKNIISSNDWIAILIKFADTLDHVERLPYIEDIEIQARLSAKYAKSLKMLRVALDESLNCPPKDIH